MMNLWHMNTHSSLPSASPGRSFCSPHTTQLYVIQPASSSVSMTTQYCSDSAQHSVLELLDDHSLAQLAHLSG